MLITKEVKKIDSMSGRELDRALAEALGLKCPEGCHSFKDCAHALITAPTTTPHGFSGWRWRNAVGRAATTLRGWAGAMKWIILGAIPSGLAAGWITSSVLSSRRSMTPRRCPLRFPGVRFSP